jgi:hypothetical protein
VKVGDRSIFNTYLGHKVHGSMLNKSCIVVKIEKVLKHDAPLPHPTRFKHTLGDALKYYENWLESYLVHHFHDNPINIPQDKVMFICTRVSLTHGCIKKIMCISKGMILNVHKDDMIEG